MTFTWISCDPTAAGYALFLSAILLTGWITTEEGPQPQYAVVDWHEELRTQDIRLPMSVIPTPAPDGITLFRLEAYDDAGNISWGDGGCQ